MLIFKLWRRIRSLKLDTLVGWSMYANFAAVLVGRLAGVSRIIISERNYLPQMLASDENTPLRRHVLGVLVRWLYPRATMITANAALSLRFLRRYLRSSNEFRHLPNVVDTDTFDHLAMGELPAGLPDSDTHPRIVALGRLHHQKGFDILIGAMTRVAELHDWHLVLAGDGPQESELREMTKLGGLDGRVHFVGKVTNPFPLYRWADVVVVPSRYEGFPNVPMEAMSIGAAVIVADCRSGPRELSCDGQFARLVPVGDERALAAAIIDMGAHLPTARRLGLAAREHVQTCYGRKHIESVYLDVFRP